MEKINTDYKPAKNLKKVRLNFSRRSHLDVALFKTGFVSLCITSIETALQDKAQLLIGLSTLCELLQSILLAITSVSLIGRPKDPWNLSKMLVLCILENNAVK